MGSAACCHNASHTSSSDEYDAAMRSAHGGAIASNSSAPWCAPMNAFVPITASDLPMTPFRTSSVAAIGSCTERESHTGTPFHRNVAM